MRKLLASMAGRDPADDYWYEEVGPRSSAGQTVTHDTAIKVAVALACIKVIAQSQAQLPLQLFFRNARGDRELAVDHPVYDLIHDQPNEEHTAVEFKEMMTAWAVARGTAYAEILPGRRGAVDQLIPLHPDHMNPIKVRDASGRGHWQWEYCAPGEPMRRILRDDLFLLRALAVQPNSPLGVDPIMAAKDTIGAALAAADYGNRFFSNDATPSGVIEWDSHFKNEESQSIWTRAWRKAFSGKNRHSVAVLTHGMKYHQIGLTNEQAQLLETRAHLDVDVCRVFGVQPHKVGILDRATFSNIEEQSIAFVRDTMMPWLVRWEQAIKRDLLSSPRFYAEHNVASLQRGDIKSRYESYAIGRQWGYLSVNEIRRMENLDGIGPSGDVYLQPSNMAPAGEGDDPTPPPASGENAQELRH